jgi:putative transposase
MASFQVNIKINIYLEGFFMARQRKLTEERRSLINQLLATYKPEDAEGVQSMLKDLLGDTLQGMLEAEFEKDLGYSIYR